MPASVVGLALVGGGVVTAATLGYIAMGVTVAGMVTKNKTLLKIGGQLGLAAGVSSIASSFMGASSGAAEAATSGVGESISAAAEDAANMGLAAPSGQMGGATGGLTATDLDYSNDAINAAGKPYPQTPGQLKESGWDSAVDYGGKTPDSNVYANQPTAGAAADNRAGLLGTPQGADLGSTQGAGAGQELGSTQGTTQLQGKSGSFFDFLKDKDGTYNKQLITEGGKIVAGGIQGLNTTSVENAKLAEARRLTDIQRANAASVGKSNYGILRS